MEKEKNLSFMNGKQKEEYKKCINIYNEKYSEKIDFEIFEAILRKFIEMGGKYDDIDFDFIVDRICFFSKEDYKKEKDLISSVSEAFYYNLYGKDAYAKFLGTINLGKKVMVSDPCYDTDTWCIEVLNNVKPGKYDCYAIVTADLDYHIIGALSVVPEGEEPKIASMNKSVADIGVDSGTCGIYNYDYYDLYHYDKDAYDSNFEGWYETFVMGMYDKEKGDDYYNLTDNQGVITQTAYGDGSYNLFTDNDENGKINAMTVIYFIPSFWDPIHKNIEGYEYNIIGKVNATDEITFNIGNYGDYKRLTMMVDKYGKNETVNDFIRRYFDYKDVQKTEDNKEVLETIESYNDLFELNSPAKTIELEHPIEKIDEDNKKYYIIGLVFTEYLFSSGYNLIIVDTLENKSKYLPMARLKHINWAQPEQSRELLDEIIYLKDNESIL